MREQEEKDVRANHLVSHRVRRKVRYTAVRKTNIQKEKGRWVKVS